MLKRTKKEDEIYQKLVSKGTRAAAIRAKCLDCCCYSFKEVRLCPSNDCPLWRFRMGREIKREE